MKTSSSELFDLIKSMTGSEKGYFKKHAGLTGNDKVFLKLFDAIDAQTVYDESKLKEKFSGEQFIKQISVAKINLYNRILKILNQLAVNSNPKFELRNQSNFAEILFNKGLTSQALKMAYKLKTLAEETEELDVLLQLTGLEKTILLKSYTDNEVKLEKLHEEELVLLAKKENSIQYQKLYHKLYNYLTKFGHSRDRKDDKVYEEILKSVYMKEPGLADTTLSKVYYHEILMLNYLSKRQFAEAVIHTTACMKLIEKNPAFQSAHIDKYLSVYQNHILQYFYLQQFSEVESNSQLLLKKLDDKKLKVPERARITCIGKLYCIRMTALINSTRFDKALEMAMETEKYLNEHKDSADKSIRTVIYNITAYLYFITENSSKALKWINMLLNDPELKYFVELSCNAKWFELLIHFELGNYDHIDNALNTNKRYIDRNAKLYGIEKLMIKFLHNACGNHKISNDQYFMLLKDLRKLMNAKNPAEYSIDYYDIAAWAESKAKNIPIRKFLEERYINSI